MGNIAILIANLLLSPTVKEFLKSANISQSYERISSGTFFMAHGVQGGQAKVKPLTFLVVTFECIGKIQ